MCAQMADLLPTSASALPHLRNLTLQALGLEDFPERVAASLQRLTSLNLAENNFARLPPALKLIGSLNDLHFHRNPRLQLEEKDVDTVAAMPHLQILYVSKSSGGANSDAGLTERSVSVLIALTKRFPNLRLPSFAL